MVATGTALTLIAITLLALLAITAATIYLLPPLMAPIEDEGHHG